MLGHTDTHIYMSRYKYICSHRSLFVYLAPEKVRKLDTGVTTAAAAAAATTEVEVD